MGTNNPNLKNLLGDGLVTALGTLGLVVCLGFLAYDLSENWWPRVSGQVLSIETVGRTGFGTPGPSGVLYKLSYEYKLLDTKYFGTATAEGMTTTLDDALVVIYNPLSVTDSKILSVNAQDPKMIFLLLMFSFLAAGIVVLGARSLGSQKETAP